MTREVDGCLPLRNVCLSAVDIGVNGSSLMETKKRKKTLNGQKLGTQRLTNLNLVWSSYCGAA